MSRFTKLNSAPIPLDGGIDPPAESLDKDYVQQPGNSRPCIKCGKMHDTIVENTRTGERLEELEKCKDCFMENAFSLNPIAEQIILRD